MYEDGGAAVDDRAAPPLGTGDHPDSPQLDARDLVVRRRSLMKFTEGAIDLYVHAMPDLHERRGDDVDLAVELKDAGVERAVHRHHFAGTAERAALARRATGFDLRGAILCNDAVGGLNPLSVEWALVAGAVWVGLPTLSARAQRRRVDRFPGVSRRALTFGPCDLTLTDDEGVLRPAVLDILRLAGDADVPVNIGYATFDECHAVLNAAAAAGVERLVVTNPATTMEFSEAQVDRLMQHPGLFIEQTCYSMHPMGSYKGDTSVSRHAVGFVARYGASRVALSSDGGIVGPPPPPALLEWGARNLVDCGLDAEAVRTMVHDTPARILGMSPANSVTTTGAASRSSALDTQLRTQPVPTPDGGRLVKLTWQRLGE
jgi:Family of unknown function (DUF6282)